MKAKIFIRTLLPVWSAELALTGLHYAYGAGTAGTLGTVFLLTSIVLLPFIAGFLVVNSGGGIALAMAGAASISVVSISAVGISYFISAASLVAFGGLLVDALMFSLVPQTVCGAIGGLAARMTRTKPAV